MSRLSKTASAGVAALVVSGAAVVVSLTGPALIASTGPAAASTTTGPASTTSPPGDEASGLPAGATAPSSPAPHAVLFLGDSAALHPRGGAAKSFACRAAASLDWRCTVRSRAGVVPAGVRADVVVLLMTPRDDATTVGGTLGALPAGLRGARTVILAPIAVSTSTAVAAHLPAVRRLAAARGADLVDPVAQHWVTAATRRVYLAADGVQPTAVGLPRLAARLAQSLVAVSA